MPSTFWSVPMSGVHIALRTLWMRIDLPLKRSSAAALSERIATRSSTALRAIDCGTCFAALASPEQLFRHIEQQRQLLLAPRYQGLRLDLEVRRATGQRLVDDDLRHVSAHGQLA